MHDYGQAFDGRLGGANAVNSYLLADSVSFVRVDHIQAIAHKHFQTKFVKIEVENAPFLVNRLQIQTLPCVVSFIDGIGVDRYVLPAAL